MFYSHEYTSLYIYSNRAKLRTHRQIHTKTGEKSKWKNDCHVNLAISCFLPKRQTASWDITAHLQILFALWIGTNAYLMLVRITHHIVLFDGCTLKNFASLSEYCIKEFKFIVLTLMHTYMYIYLLLPISFELKHLLLQ